MPSAGHDLWPLVVRCPAVGAMETEGPAAIPSAALIAAMARKREPQQMEARVGMMPSTSKTLAVCNGCLLLGSMLRIEPLAAGAEPQHPSRSAVRPSRCHRVAWSPPAQLVALAGLDARGCPCLLSSLGWATVARGPGSPPVRFRDLISGSPPRQQDGPKYVVVRRPRESLYIHIGRQERAE